MERLIDSPIPIPSLFVVKNASKSLSAACGFAHFNKEGRHADEAKLKTCFPCHEPVSGRDFIFTRSAP
jgi:hypothetical protein